jgi:streptomycin 6-kinase
MPGGRSRSCGWRAVTGAPGSCGPTRRGERCCSNGSAARCISSTSPSRGGTKSSARRRRIWRPATGCSLPTGADKARQLSGFITAAWEELGRPCSQRAIDYALACAAQRAKAHDDERAVLVHGDVHQWNALQARGGFKLVDPDGLLAEAEYDMGVVMREDPIELLHGDPHQRARWLAARCNLDATAIWQWGVAERVATGLLLTRIELQPVGREMLTAADHVAR